MHSYFISASFIKIFSRFQQHGLDGLIGKPPIPDSHPNELTDETKQKIIDLSLKHPTFGQQRIADQLSLEGVSVSTSSVRNLWIKQDMETRYKRLLWLEKTQAKETLS